MRGVQVAATLLALTTFGGIGCASNPRNTSSSERDLVGVSTSSHSARHRVTKHEPEPAQATPVAQAPNPVPNPPPEIRVMGEVEKPGMIAFQKGADLAFYVSQAGGPSHDSKIRRVQIIRGKPGSRVASEYAVSGQGLKKLPAVHDGDIVIVHTADSDPDKSPVPSTGNPLSVKAAATFFGTMALLFIAI